MATYLYRCLNESCSDAGEGEVPVHDFTSEEKNAPCPKCKATQKSAPHRVVPRETIHYLVNDTAGAIRTPNGRRAVACDPARAKMPKYATGEPSATSCPACQASKVYADHVASNVDQGQRIVTKDVPMQLLGGAFDATAK